MESTSSIRKTLTSYAEIRAGQGKFALRRFEVPVGHAISLPLPTLRWNEPAFAFSASPARHLPGKPPLQFAPDRHWAIAAHGGALIVYALARAVPLGPAAMPGPVEVAPVAASVAETEKRLSEWDVLMTKATVEFFEGRQPSERDAVKDAFRGLVAEPLWPFYRELTPDFWQALAL
jgi:hypothetical protein